MNGTNRRSDGYSGGKLPLRDYATLAAFYNLTLAAALLVTRARRRLPQAIDGRDIVLLGVATHKLSRLLAKDWVTSFYRAPFTEFAGSTAIPGEISDRPRGHGLRFAIGQLVV